MDRDAAEADVNFGTRKQGQDIVNHGLEIRNKCRKHFLAPMMVVIESWGLLSPFLRDFLSTACFVARANFKT